MISNMRFMKESEFIAIDGANVTFSIDVATPEKDGLFFVSIPSLRIYSSAPSENAIKLAVNAAIDSFLSYWMKMKTESEFLNHLKSLGFSSDTPANPTKRKALSMVRESEAKYKTKNQVHEFEGELLDLSTHRFIYNTQAPA